MTNAVRERGNDETRLLHLSESELALALKKGGAQTFTLEGGGVMEVNLAEAYWLSLNEVSREGDVGVQLGLVIPAPDGELYGIVDAASHVEYGLPRAVLITRLAQHPDENPELIAVLKPNTTEVTGSNTEDWLLGIKLSGDTPAGIDKVRVSYDGPMPLEIIGATSHSVETKNPLPPEIWVPAVDEVRRALQMPGY